MDKITKLIEGLNREQVGYITIDGYSYHGENRGYTQEHTDITKEVYKGTKKETKDVIDSAAEYVGVIIHKNGQAFGEWVIDKENKLVRIV